MDLREFNPAKIRGARRDNPTDGVSVTLSFTIRDRELLWDAAAVAGLSAAGMCLNDVIDVIGPREDPAIAECIAMLAQPASLPGCELAGFEADLIVPAQDRTQTQVYRAA
jgi:hypothetical protein